MSDSGNSELSYQIDPAGTIVSVSGSWSDPAQALSSSGGVQPNPVGTLLWSHISSGTLIHLYQALVAKVRRTGEELVLPFQCHSPESQRFMEMRIRRLPAGLVEFSTRLLREAPRGSEPAPEPGGMVRMCSWCKRVLLDDWVEIDEAVRRLGLFELEQPPRVTHTICRECLGEIRKGIR